MCAFAACHFRHPFVKLFALCYRTFVCPVRLDCDIGVLWPNGWMDQDATSYGGRLPRKRGTASPPIFGPCLLWPNSWMDQDTTW